MLSDFESKLVVLLLGGQDAINEEVSGFKVIGFEGQLFNGVSSCLITSAHVNQMNVIRDCHTCSGELEYSC